MPQKPFAKHKESSPGCKNCGCDKQKRVWYFVFIAFITLVSAVLVTIIISEIASIVAMPTGEKLLTCPNILSCMVIIGFMCHHMLRINISLAILDMMAKNSSNVTLMTQVRRFNWNQKEKNEILGCFFWGYLVTEIPGGRLSEIYGTRIVLGTAMLLAGLFTILTPIASYLHYYWIIVVRTGLGLALGVTWPSVYPMVVKWVAPTDRAKFVSHTIASSIGAALTFPLCGYLIAYLGWPSVFYVTGAIMLAWVVAWFYLIYDSPGQHPRISDEEREALEKEIMCETSLSKKRKTPWKQIFISGPVWAIVVANTTFLFTFYIILNQLPTYMHDVLGFDIKENGLLSSLPYFARYFVSVGSCYLADRLGKSRKFTTISIRYFFTTAGAWGPGFLFLIQSFWGYNRAVSIVIFTLSLAFLGCSTAGYLSNCLDIAPVYSGTIFGIANTIGALTGYISTELVAFVTKENQNFDEWKYIFWILAATNLLGSIFSFIFASGELQSWNPKCNEAEMEKLRPDRHKFSEIANEKQTSHLPKM